MSLIKLVAPEGATSVNHKGQDYKVKKNGTIEVPECAVEQLVGGHGFSFPKEPKTAEELAAEKAAEEARLAAEKAAGNTTTPQSNENAGNTPTAPAATPFAAPWAAGSK